MSALLKKKSLYDTFYANIGENIDFVVIDRVTGLFSRGYFEHFLYREIRKTDRYKTPVSLITLTIGDSRETSKTPNDSDRDYNFIELGSIIKGNIREVDIGARYAESKFALVLPNTPLDGAKIVFERIKKLIRENRNFKDATSEMQSLQMGISCCPDDGDNVESIVEAAEEAACDIFDRT